MMSRLALIRAPIGAFGWRLFSLFRDPPSWAEFGSAVMVSAYGASFFIHGKSPEAWDSLTLVTDLLPDWQWAILSLLCGLSQFLGLYLGRRFLRFSAASGILLWVAVMWRFVWPLYPFSPLLVGYVAGIVTMNVLVVARHVRDW